MIHEEARVGIIGGTGRMGSWMAGLLERRGHHVLKAGRRTRIMPEDVAQSCDVIVISVPVDVTIPVIERIAPLVRNDAMLMDLTSLKAAPMEAMLSLCRGQVVGLHPLFGPTAHLEEGPLTVAACRGRGESGFRWIQGRLQGEGYCVKEIDPAEHDRIMAVIQGVYHFSTIALGIFFNDCGIPPEDLWSWSTPAFRAMLNRIRALAAQPGGLFRAILTENPAAGDFIVQYRSAVETLNHILSLPDRARFERAFGRLKAAFGNGDCPDLMGSTPGIPGYPSARLQRKGERHV